MTAYDILRWIHILCMVGLFGGLLLFQLGLSTPTRMDAADLRGSTRLWNIMLGVEFIAGGLMYGIAKGHTLGGHYNGVIIVKFVILLAVGGLLAAAKRSANGDRLRWLCIGLLLLASFSAFSL